MNESGVHHGSAKRKFWLLVAIGLVCAVLVFVVTGLLTSIFERRQEARNPYVRLVEVNEETTDPRPGASTGRANTTTTSARRT